MVRSFKPKPVSRGDLKDLRLCGERTVIKVRKRKRKEKCIELGTYKLLKLEERIGAGEGI